MKLKGLQKTPVESQIAHGDPEVNNYKSILAHIGGNVYLPLCINIKTLL